MRRASLMAVAAALAVLAPAAEAKVTCDGGSTLFAEGRLRILATFFDTPDETGYNAFACLGRAGRPRIVGGHAVTPGTASGDTPAYAFGGGRYLGALSISDGEGGPSSDVTVTDLRTRRTVNFLNLACCEGVPELRVAADGTIAVRAPGDGVVVKRPRRSARAVSAENGRDVAMAGGTVYWSEAGQARSLALGGLAGSAEARLLEPVVARKRGGPCPAAKGRTIVATGNVRVVERTGRARRFACRVGRSRRLRAGPAGGPAPRIVGGRWLLVLREDGAAVADTRTMTTRYAVPGPIRSATLLRDGTLLWIGGAGRLLRRGLFDAAAVTMSDRVASALAGARRVAYWTEDGLPRRYEPPSPARSASKPG
jgi:hypothetical protein